VKPEIGNAVDGAVELGGQDSLSSPNARNKFAFALGDRKLLAILKFLNMGLTGFAGIPWSDRNV
jgi:hypothetical protein